METEREVDYEKRALRRQVLAARHALTEEDRRRAGVLLTERILGHQWFYLSQVILGFVSFGDEIDTKEILREALRLGKQVYVPKVEGDDMYFYLIHSLSELREGYKGILEPAGNAEQYRYCEKQQTNENDSYTDGTGLAPFAKTLLMMPGVAFDLRRNRCGYGKGFYDRFLSDKPKLQLRSIAVGYQCQLVEHVPAGERDIKPYQVICV